MDSAVEKVATEFPKTQFTIIDIVVDKPNVQSVIFKKHEGSFLVGTLAAIASKSGNGRLRGRHGYPADPLRKFQCGYEQGAKYVNPKIELFQNMAGSTPAAFADLAKSQFAKGADVVYAAAGDTGIGVYQAAKDSSKYVIGVDSNQNHLQPGTMLTSMVKSVGLAAYQTWGDAAKGEWKPGINNLGLAEGGVDWALDKDNEKLITPEMKAKVDAIKAEIISGKVNFKQSAAATPIENLWNDGLARAMDNSVAYVAAFTTDAKKDALVIGFPESNGLLITADKR